MSKTSEQDSTSKSFDIIIEDSDKGSTYTKFDSLMSSLNRIPLSRSYVGKPIEPEILPLKTIEEVNNWRGVGNAAEILLTIPPVSSHSKKVPLHPTSSEIATPPTYRTLVCHDHCNGYQDDRYCNGTTNREAYRFYHWYGLDIFVYFSHNFVTIPPCGWVAAAHLHGVIVLGTLITEWEAGASKWEQLLSSPETTKDFIDTLVTVTGAYRFDGWFVNVEHNLTKEQTQKLIQFVKDFTIAIHKLNPSFKVIWYDAITIEGRLDFQNELNSNNKPFFDACDGIFVNYAWDANNLTNTVAAAGDRINDVYAGVDVYCRNVTSGGGYGTVKQVSFVRQMNLSVGLFAISWSYDKFGREGYFYTANALWNSYKPYLLYHGFNTIPFVTNFCQGFGRNYYRDGKVETEGPWYNLNKQQSQPIMEELSDTIVGIETDDAFNGGSSLSIYVDENITKFRLFLCDIPIKNMRAIQLTYKLDGLFDYFVVTFGFSAIKSRKFILKTSDREKDAKDPNNIFPSVSSSPPDIVFNGWTISTFDFHINANDVLSSIYINVDGTGVIHFGAISIT